MTHKKETLAEVYFRPTFFLVVPGNNFPKTPS